MGCILCLVYSALMYFSSTQDVFWIFLVVLFFPCYLFFIAVSMISLYQACASLCFRNIELIHLRCFFPLSPRSV